MTASNPQAANVPALFEADPLTLSPRTRTKRTAAPRRASASTEPMGAAPSCSRPVHAAAKRAVDIVVATAVGVIALPLLGVIALLIKLDSAGPVIFRQTRPGLGAAGFHICKFRTMHVHCGDRFDLLNGEQQQQFRVNGKVDDDPRVTRLGRWLRRASLDELPQLWNVLRGEMSLIGPRPYLPSQVTPGRAHRIIAQVRPGITGLWQISGRNDLPHRRRICLDVYYVRRRNILLDLYILLRTPVAVISRTGAR